MNLVILGVHNFFILHPNQELSTKSIALGMRFQKNIDTLINEVDLTFQNVQKSFWQFDS
jgi:hypothetical protein